MKRLVLLTFALSVPLRAFCGVPVFTGSLFGPFNYTEVPAGQPMIVTEQSQDNGAFALLPAGHSAYFCLYNPVNFYPVKVSGTVMLELSGEASAGLKACLINGKPGGGLFASCVDVYTHSGPALTAEIPLSEFPGMAVSVKDSSGKRAFDFSAVRGIGIISGNAETRIKGIYLNEARANTSEAYIKPADIIIDTAVNSHGVYAGTYLEHGRDPGYYSGLTGKKPAFFVINSGFSDPFPLDACKTADSYGSLSVINWDPVLSDGTPVTYEMIKKGVFNAYMNDFAKAAAEFGKPLIICPLRLANDQRQAWALHHNKNSFPDYKDAFLRCAMLFKKNRASNVMIAFSYAAGLPRAHLNDPSNIYPGNDLVSFLMPEVSDSSMFGPASDAALKFAPGKTLIFTGVSLKSGDALLLNSLLYARGLAIDPKPFRDKVLNSSLRTELASDFFISDPSGMKDALGPRQLPPSPSPTPTALPVTEDKPIIKALSVSDPVIDGFNKENMSLSAGLQNSRVHVAYNSSNLILYVESDIPPSGNGKMRAALKDGDCVTICLSSDPSLSKSRKKAEASDFIIYLGASKETETYNRNLMAPLDRAKIAFRPLKKGWALEASIPWHNFMTGCLCKLNGRKTEFNVIVKSSGKTDVYHGSPLSETSPSEWGYIIFGGDKR